MFQEIRIVVISVHLYKIQELMIVTPIELHEAIYPNLVFAFTF